MADGNGTPFSQVTLVLSSLFKYTRVGVEPTASMNETPFSNRLNYQLYPMSATQTFEF